MSAIVRRIGRFISRFRCLPGHNLASLADTVPADSERTVAASGGLRRDCDCGGELAAVVPCLLFGFPAELVGKALELVECRVDTETGELGLDYAEVEVPNVGEDAAHPPVAWSHPSRGVPGR